MNKIIEIHQPVVDISSGGNSLTRAQTNSPGEESTWNGESSNELDALPLSEFERSMARLQQTEEEERLPEIIARLEDNYAKERENIYNSGYQAGMEAGQKEMQQKFREDITAVEQLIQEMEASRWRIQKEAELSLVNLAMQIARQIIKAEITLHPDTIRHVIKETLEYARNLEVLAVELNPEDYAYISQHSDFLNDLPENIHIKKDAGIARGGCIIHTNMESIDAKIETKLKHLGEQLYQNITEEG